MLCKDYGLPADEVDIEERELTIDELMDIDGVTSDDTITSVYTQALRWHAPYMLVRSIHDDRDICFNTVSYTHLTLPTIYSV